VLWDGAHGVIGDAGGDRTVHPGWVGEEWVQAPVAALGGSCQFYVVKKRRNRMGLRRRGRCRCRRSGQGRNSGLRQHVEWGNRSYRNCRETKGIPLRRSLASRRRSTAVGWLVSLDKLLHTRLCAIRSGMGYATDLVLVILVHVDTGLLRLPPFGRYALINVRLMYYLGNQLRPGVD